jgi:tRNA modification GTPase
VILAVLAADTIEIHCHGGAQLVRCLMEELQAAGARLVPASAHPLVQLLAQAPTRRVAELLLDQWYGACERAFRRVWEAHDEATLAQLVQQAHWGRQLPKPWQVALAGPPNVGKSSLLNALVGFPRAIVSPIPGTTRDAVTVTVAIDGWPVEWVDTAGVRPASEQLEAAGIARTHRWLQQAHLIVWVVDAATGEGWNMPRPQNALLVANKCDLLPNSAGPPAWLPVNTLLVSARTGAGLDALCQAILQRLLPQPPAPGDPVPFTPTLADAVEHAWQCWQRGDIPSACQILRQHQAELLPPPDYFPTLPYINSSG